MKFAIVISASVLTRATRKARTANTAVSDKSLQQTSKMQKVDNGLFRFECDFDNRHQFGPFYRDGRDV